MSAAGPDPLISVIVPAHDAQAFIAQAIASACVQTYRNLEVLVVDDGSRDRTSAIVSALAECDSRVRLLRQRHRGVAAARNRALAEARGEYVAPLDADDIWFPRKIEHQVHVLQSAADAGLAYNWTVDVDEYGRLTGGYYAHEQPPNVPAALIYRNFVGCSSVPLIRRSCFEHTGPYDESGYAARGVQGCEDLDLYLRIAERYEFVLVREFLVGYRQSRRRMSSDAVGMARSFHLALRNCRRRRPQIPWRVLCWSMAQRCFHLHLLARGNVHYVRAAALLLASMWLDPRLLLEPSFYCHLLPRRLRAARPAIDPALRSPAVATALAAIEAQRARLPSATFDRFEGLYRRRLRFTETVLAHDRRIGEMRAPMAGATAPVLEQPRL